MALAMRPCALTNSPREVEQLIVTGSAHNQQLVSVSGLQSCNAQSWGRMGLATEFVHC